MSNCGLYWSRIKKQSWDKFPDRQLYLDEGENIFALKRKDGKIVVVGYMHFIRPECWHFGDNLRKFASDVIALARDKFKTSDIVIISNKLLESLKIMPKTPYPEEAAYYHIDSRGEITKDPLDKINEHIKSKIAETEQERIKKKNARLSGDDSYDYYLNDGPNEEEIIMGAIKYGYGDIYGYG